MLREFALFDQNSTKYLNKYLRFHRNCSWSTETKIYSDFLLRGNKPHSDLSDFSQTQGKNLNKLANFDVKKKKKN